MFTLGCVTYDVTEPPHCAAVMVDGRVSSVKATCDVRAVRFLLSVTQLQEKETERLLITPIRLPRLLLISAFVFSC